MLVIRVVRVTDLHRMPIHPTPTIGHPALPHITRTMATRRPRP